MSREREVKYQNQYPIQQSPYGQVQPYQPSHLANDQDMVDTGDFVNVDTVDGWKKIAKYWKLQFDRKKMEYDNEHQRFVSLYGMFEQIKNEYNGLIRRGNVNVEEMRLEEILSDYAAHKDIQDVVRENYGKSKSSWLKVTWQIVALVLGIFLLWQLATNQSFQYVVTQNMTAIVIIVVVVAGLVLILRNQGGDKKKRK